jgi:hypothetical protein
MWIKLGAKERHKETNIQERNKDEMKAGRKETASIWDGILL